MNCLFCGKELLNIKGKFCNSSCSASYNNLHRKSTTKGKTKLCKCIKCGREFNISLHANSNKFVCNECKINKPHYKEKLNSIKDISTRTVSKLIKRSNVGCIICNWNESTCDLHHIIPKSKGGTDDDSNLILVCPNCHRVIHTTNKYSIQYLLSLSIANKFNWRMYYHPRN